MVHFFRRQMNDLVGSIRFWTDSRYSGIKKICEHKARPVGTCMLSSVKYRIAVEMSKGKTQGKVIPPKLKGLRKKALWSKEDHLGIRTPDHEKDNAHACRGKTIHC